MPGKDPLSQIGDLAALQGNVEEIIKLVQKVSTEIKAVPNIALAYKDSGGGAELKKNTDDLVKANNDLLAAQERIMALEKTMQALKEKGAASNKVKTEEEIRQQAALQLERQKALQSAKDEIRLNQAAEESLNKKRIQLKQLQAQYDALAGSVRSAAEGEKLLKNIQALDAQVKVLEGSTGRFQRNVGNYADGFKNFGDVGKEALHKVNDGFGDFFKNIARTAVAFIGVQGIFEFFKSSIETFEKSELSIKREENALKNLGASARDVTVLTKSIDDLTGKFSYLSKVDLRESQQKLVTYGKLTADQISGLLPTIVNFAANARIGVTEATDVLIKGLEGNAKAMKTYGINIKDAGSVSERFSLIQSELATKVAGSAQIFAESGEGKIEAYKRQLGSLRKGIGEQLLPVYEEFLNGTLKVGSALKTLDFGSIVKGLAALTGLWVIYKGVVAANTLITVLNTSAMVANKAVSEGMTVAKAAETLAEETNGKTKAANTVLTYTIAAAQRVYAAATKVATFEVTLFGNAIRITPLGIFLTVLGLTITAFSAFASKSSIAADSLAKNKLALEANNEAMKQGNQVFAEQKNVIDELVKKIQDHTLKLGERKKALDELLELDPKYLNGLTLENIETAKGAAILDNYVNALHRKADAEAAGEILKADALKRTKAQLDLDVENANWAKTLETADKARRGNVAAGNSNEWLESKMGGLKSAHEKIVEELNATITEVDSREGALNNILTKNRTSVQFNQQSGLGKYNEDDKGDDKDKDRQKRELDFQAKLLELLKQEQIDRLKIIVDSKDSPAFQRLQAEQQIFQLEKEMIEGRRDIELKNTKLTVSERAYIIEKANDDLYKKEVEFHVEVMKIRTESNQKEREDELTTVKDLIAIREAYYKAQEELIKLSASKIQNYNDEARDYLLKSLEERFAQGVIKEEDYNKEKKRITADAQKYTLDAQLKELEAQKNIAAAKNLELPTDKQTDLTKLDADIAHKKLEIEQNKDAGVIASNKKTADLKKQLQADEIQAAKQAESTIADFVKGAYDSQINAIQKKIDRGNLDRETEEHNIATSTLSATQKAAYQLELDKQTAASNAELARKQRDIKNKEAVFDRDKALFDITANTGVSILKTAAELGYPAALPFIEIAAATGTIETAAVLAKQLPKYARGVDSSPKGFAVVGEEGSEMRIEPSGKTSMTPGHATLTYLEAGTRIIPHDKLQQYRTLDPTINVAKPNNQLEKKIDRLTQTLERVSMDQLNATKKIKSQQVIIYDNSAFLAHIKNSTQ